MIKVYDIRDPIHGFIQLDEWEREIVDHPVFQRLRRIRQLGLTDMVYPSAMHTRFEHSLGVMHLATRMFDTIRKKRSEFLKSELSFTETGLDRDRVLVRLSCLLHDIGHAPFSHAAEGLMDKDGATGKFYDHEDYSAAVVLFMMKDVIENHQINQNFGIKAKDIADFLKREKNLGRCLLWRDLLSSQLDADRADYLLRDSHHIGVAYGHYDLNRLVTTMTVANDPEKQSSVLAIEEGGEHAAEALIIARYMMFTQVYFQHTRRAYDHHLSESIKTLLQKQQKNTDFVNKSAFPSPTSKENLEAYLKWDDWRVLGMIHAGEAEEHGRILMDRTHDRSIYETQEVPCEEDSQFVEEIVNKLGSQKHFVDCAEKSWYKFESADIPILLRPTERDQELTTLSRRSSVVNGLKAVKLTRIYVPLDKKDNALKIISDLRSKKEK